MTDPLDSLAAGTLVGAYRIEGTLGRGGAGTVYAAEEPTIKKRVAVKVLNRAFAADAAMRARFEREARAVNEIHHPGIVDVFAFGALPDGRPYLVMSLLEGRSLRDELGAKGKLGAADAWPIAREVAEAVAAAHEAGIIHRDLKPDNVFLERFGERTRARILDFGVAKVPEGEGGGAPMNLTGTGIPIGTPAYMAPEQWWGEGITARTDQYAFGVMLFEMLAGRPPFTATQFARLVQDHVEGKPPTLAEAGVSASPAVEDFVARLLAKSGDDRFESMRALVEAGDRAFGGATSLPTPEGPRPELEAPAIVPSAVPAASAPALPASPAGAALRRYLAMHAAVVVLGFLGVMAVGYAGDGRHDPRQWSLIGGWGQIPVFATLPVGAVWIALLARRRARTGEPARVAFFLALLPAMLGAFSTYTGWHAILRTLGQSQELQRLALMSEGTYEANAGRFTGFAIAAILLVSLAAFPGVSGLAASTTTLSGAIGVRRREAIGAALGLTAIAVVAIVVGAPSGALVAGAGALVLAASAAIPTVHSETAVRDEVERAVAGLLAVALAAAVGVTRIEARESVLWQESPTRAARVAEIIAAEAERSATLPIAALSLAVIVVVESLRIQRLWPHRPIGRPRPATALLAAVLVIGVVLDQLQHARFIGKRDELRAEIAAQFALFARLDPPPGDRLDPKRFPPHRATAVQAAREALAIDAKGVERLAALDSPEGTAHFAAELNRALAQVAVEQGATGEVDLSISVDREVKGASLLRLLRIARTAGVRRVELLLTRGAPPAIAPGAPAESRIVMPHDFVALPAELADDGVPLDPARSFGEIAPDLVGRAGAGDALRLAL